jgi:hypothetical protein
MMAYDSKLLFQNNRQAQRTARLRELGAGLVTAIGSLGNQVSNADREVYERASGNFQQPKSLGEMEESIASMERIARKAIDKANTTMKIYRDTGRLPPREIVGGPTAVLPRGQAADASIPKMTREQAIELLMRQPHPQFPGRTWTRQQADQYFTAEEQKLKQ